MAMFAQKRLQFSVAQMTSFPDSRNLTACTAVSQRLAAPYSCWIWWSKSLSYRPLGLVKSVVNIRGRWNQIPVFFKEVVLFGDRITIHMSGNWILHWGKNTGWGCWRIWTLRKIFGLKMDEITGEWKRLYDEGLFTKYFSVDEIKRNEMGGHLAREGDKRCTQSCDGETRKKETTWRT